MNYSCLINLNDNEIIIVMKNFVLIIMSGGRQWSTTVAGGIWWFVAVDGGRQWSIVMDDG